MKVTSVAVFPVTTSKAGSIKANGVVTLENTLDLKCIVIEGPSGPFVTWKGSEPYKKADGKTAYNHAIFVKDKDLQQEIQSQVLAKLNSLTGSRDAHSPSPDPVVDNSFTSDDIPF